jgi:2',3'-cyclic-nucleotide 2'-phosphodiesterase (5'-nucleotidase family)
MRNAIRSVVSIALSLLVVVPAGTTAAAAGGGDRELVILSSASTRGEVSPCRCKSRPKGGLARRVRFVDSLRAAEGELLVLDAGDVVNPRSTRGERHDRFILETMGDMQVDAMTLGELELGRGPEFVRMILRESRVPVTLANARFADTGQPIGERFFVREVNGIRTAIAGLVASKCGDRDQPIRESQFRIAQPAEVAAGLLPEMRASADLVIVLAHMTAADARQLAGAVPGIDVIVVGHAPGTGGPARVGGSLIVEPGSRGYSVSETRLVLDPENRIVSHSDATVVLAVDRIGEDAATASELAALSLPAGD